MILFFGSWRDALGFQLIGLPQAAKQAENEFHGVFSNAMTTNPTVRQVGPAKLIKIKSTWRAKLAGEPTHSVRLEGVDGDRDLFGSPAGGTLKGPVLKAPPSGRDAQQGHPVLTGRAHRTFVDCASHIRALPLWELRSGRSPVRANVNIAGATTRRRTASSPSMSSRMRRTAWLSE